MKCCFSFIVPEWHKFVLHKIEPKHILLSLRLVNTEIIGKKLKHFTWGLGIDFTSRIFLKMALECISSATNVEKTSHFGGNSKSIFPFSEILNWDSQSTYELVRELNINTLTSFVNNIFSWLFFKFKTRLENEWTKIIARNSRKM